MGSRAVAPTRRHRALSAGLVALALCASSAPRRTQADGPTVLFVTDSVTLGLGDAAIKARLEATGYSVEVRPGTSPSLGDISGKTLVLVSASAPAATVGVTFRDALIPVVTWQSALFDDMRMTGTVSGVDFGTSTHFTELVLPEAAPAEPVPANPRHPGSLTAYLPRTPGIITVTSSEGPFSWGRPATAAWVAATLGVSNNAGIFAYEESDTMVGTPPFSAPARRVGLFMTASTAASFNDDAWALFDAAVVWATFKNTRPVVSAGPDFGVDPRDQVLLGGSVQDDGMPFSKTKALTVQWTKEEGLGTPLFSNPASALTAVSFPAPSPPTLTQVYRLRLSASDGQLSNSVVGNSCLDANRPQDVCVTVAFQNRPPVVAITPVAPVTLPGSAAIIATATDEGLVAPMTYAWSKVSGPGNVTFSAPTAVNTSATFTTKGFYELRLSVADGQYVTEEEVQVDVEGNALLVVGNTETAGDTALKNRLLDLGYSVTVTLSSAVQTSQAANRSLVVIAGTAVDTSVASKFRDVAQPVVVLKHSLLDNMSMTGATSGTHFGSVASQSQVTIVTPGSVLAAGLSGTFSTNTTAGTFSWGDPPANPPSGAVRVARLASTAPADANKATVFSYEAGATMFGTFVAPGRRIGFFAQDAAAGSFTPQGGWLFDAAVAWASGMNRAPRANAGLDQGAVLAVPGPTAVTLVGSAVDDGPPLSLTYEWTSLSAAGPAQIDDRYNAQTVVRLPVVGLYEFRLTVRDGSLASADDVKVWVSNPNEPPTVSISIPAVTPLTVSPMLVGTVSDDGLPQPPGALTLFWSKTSGPGTVTFGSPSSATTTATFTKKGVYTVQLSAFDGAASTTATATIDAREAALLITDGKLSGAGSEGNLYLVARLGALSYDADVRTGLSLPDTAAVTAALAGKSLLVIAPSAVSADVGQKFRTKNTPAVVLKDDLYFDMGMTTAANRGSTTSQRQVAIALAGDAMTAGLTGTVTVASASAFGWGIPNANGVKIATLASDATKAAIFRYLSGLTMGGGIPAPARRVGFFAENDGPQLSLDARGEALLEAAFSWAESSNMPPRVTLPSALAARPNVPLNLPGVVFDDGLPTSPPLIQWTKESPAAGSATFANPTVAATSVTLSPAGPLPQTFVLKLQASDGESSGSALVSVTVDSQNQAPVVNAGPDLVGPEAIRLPRTALLSGLAYDDGLPGPLTLTWTKVAGPGSVTFATPTAASTTARFDAAGRYLLRLAASDGLLAASDDVVVDVESTALVVTAGPSPDPSEAKLIARLEGLGFVVSSASAAASTYSNADRMSVVVLSPLVVDTDVGTKFRAVAAPVIVTKQTLLDEMAMASTMGTQSATALTVALPAHPMAAGRPGSPAVPIVSPAQTIGWGESTSPSTPIRVGTVGANRAALFGFEKGTVMSGATAPERRVAFLLCLSACATSSALNAEGWAFFDAAVRWAGTLNLPPRVVVGADQTITWPNPTTVTASVVWDDGFPSPPALTYAWDLAAGPAGVAFSAPAATSTQVNFSVPGTYVLRFTAKDGVLAGTDTLTVTVLPQSANAPPYVNAGPDQEFLLPGLLTLRGQAADDGLGTGLTSTWSKLYGPGNVTFGNASLLTTTASFSAAGVYVLQLQASDGEFLVKDQVRITVAAAKSALIVNPAVPTVDDTANSDALSARLQTLGFTVTTAADTNASLTSLAASKALVFVTQRVDPVAIGTKLTDVATPVIVARASLYPAMLMADSGQGEGIDYGELTDTQVTIRAPELPLAAGLEDVVTVTTQPSLLQWALNIPPTELAASHGDPADAKERAAVFGYEKGEITLAALVAPARRVGFFGSEATRFTTEGWRLFDQAVRWATQRLVPALFVVSNQAESPENKRMSTRLSYLGYSVTRVLDSQVTAAQATQTALVVVSRSAQGSVLGSKLRDVPVPVMTFDPENFNAMGMTGATIGDDYGFAPDQVSLNILEPNHPLAAFYSGVQEVLTGTLLTDFGWALPGPGARRVAVLVGFTYGATIFAYERGAPMPALASAPERRIGLYMNEKVFGEHDDVRFTDVGWALFDAAVRHCGAADTDADGLSNYEEFRAGTDSLNRDTNGDGVPDGSQAGTPQGATNLDMDGDGVLNSVELQNGTDPFNRNTDGDAVEDGVDCFPLDPTRTTCPPSNPSDHTAPVILLQEPTTVTPFP